ncbi:MAG: LLM class flavin-dependent oxidoreductase, partial [Mesorhizobium sp.]
EMFLAALSQRTTKLRMGLGVVVLPLHHPFNVAERVATLDVLSSGRVEFGSGRGTTPYIVEGFGLDPQKSRAAGNESLQAVLRMFEEDPFTGFAGEHFELPARHVIPKPVQLPHPPLWVAATNLETYEHAARQGVGVIGVTRNSHSETRKAIETYRSISR